MNNTAILIGIFVVIVLIFLYTNRISTFSSVADAVTVPNDWNQYIRDQAQRNVYLLNDVNRGGFCFPEVLGWDVDKAAAYIKSKNPKLYIDLNDERVPKKVDIYYFQPNRVVLTFDSRNKVSRIPLSG